MEPSPTPLLRKPSPLAGGEKRARVPSSSPEGRAPLGAGSTGVNFADQCVALRPNLRRFALKLTRSTDAAEDLVQDTLVRALTKAHNYRDNGHSLLTWLFTVMQNLLNSQRRTASRRVTLELDSGKFGYSHSAPERSDIRVIIRDAVKLIKSLPKPQRDVLLLAGVEGLDYEAISARSGVLKNTVRSSLSRARAKLKAAADENYGSAPLSYEHIERGIARSFNQYTAYINGKTRYYATLQEARDARAAV